MDHLAAVGDPSSARPCSSRGAMPRAVTADELAEARELHWERRPLPARAAWSEAGLLAVGYERRTGRSGPGASEAAKTYSVIPQLESIEVPGPERVARRAARGRARRPRRRAPLREVGVSFGRDSPERHDCGPRKPRDGVRTRVRRRPAPRVPGLARARGRAGSGDRCTDVPAAPARARPPGGRRRSTAGCGPGSQSCALDGVEVGEVRCETRDCFDDHASCKVVL